MFENAKPFHLVVIGFFTFATVIGVMVFAFGGSKSSNNEGGPKVVIWGTANEDVINKVISDVNGPLGTYINATYIQKEPLNFNFDLLEAIAAGNGPDVVLASFEDIFSERSRFTVIPLNSYNVRTFQDNFIQQAELLRVNDGYLGLPFALDPLIMYWNRDIFNSKNFPNPPTHWDTVVANTPLFSDIAPDFTITKSALSMGDFRNVNHAKEILLALMFQGGSSLTSLGFNPQTSKETLEVSFGQSSTLAGISPEESALNFYTQFANPLFREYTWNRSLSNSLDLFAYGNLAMYIGLGSEISLLRAKNPNLNFDIALLPQSRNTSVSVTYGKLYGLAILSSSKNKTGAFRTISRLTEKDFLSRYAKVSGLPPVRRDLLATPLSDAYSPVLYQSAFYSKGWLDPSPEKTNTIFKGMVEAVLAGSNTGNSVMKTAESQLKILIQEFNNKNEK